MIRRVRPVTMPRHARGVGLIEVMVSLVVLAVGLLGIAAMQSMALRGGQGSLESTQAVMATNSIIESMRANSTNVASYAPYDGTASCVAVPAAGSTVATRDISTWVTNLKSTIGSGVGDATTCGKIELLASGNFRVTVQWDDRRAGGGQTRQIVTETSI